ncbi:MAG: hypothetical protein AB8G95_06820 [Anaerolineae bacterium]
MQQTSIIGLGSSKFEALAYIANQPLENLRLHFVDTVQARKTPAHITSHLIGKHLTNGLGCAGDARLGQKAAVESTDTLWSLIPAKGKVILLASMAGGTGAGLLPTMLRLAKEKKTDTHAIVTLPLIVEGQQRKLAAINNLKAIGDYSDQLIVIKQDSLQNYLSALATADQIEMFNLFTKISAWKALSLLF